VVKKQARCIVGWMHYLFLIDEAYRKIKWKEIKAIASISRGGLIPLLILGHRTGLPLLLMAEGYNDLILYPIHKFVNFGDKKKKILFIDDIYDTGHTQERIRRLFKNYAEHPQYMYLVSKKDNVNAIKQVNKDVWVQFPYETKKSTLSR